MVLNRSDLHLCFRARNRLEVLPKDQSACLSFLWNDEKLSQLASFPRGKKEFDAGSDPRLLQVRLEIRVEDLCRDLNCILLAGDRSLDCRESGQVETEGGRISLQRLTALEPQIAAEDFLSFAGEAHLYGLTLIGSCEKRETLGCAFLRGDLNANF